MVHLIADIGGTNSRFALCEEGKTDLILARKYPNADHDSLASVIDTYIKEVGEQPQKACLAVAGPAHRNFVKLTNISWEFSVDAYKKQFNLQELKLTNDFTALAMSVPHLGGENIKQIAHGVPIDHMPISVLGPGTGLGVSGLLWNGAGWTALQGEGGNTSFSPNTHEEAELLKLAQKRLGHVRNEDFISGTGLPLLHELRLELHGKPKDPVTAEEITWRAKMTGDGFCYDTVDIFCGMLGGLAGDMALLLGAFGGVYIGGGVAPQLEELFEKSSFRTQFEAKGRFEEYVSTIPTYLLLSHSRNALIGAAAMLLPTRT